MGREKRANAGKGPARYSPSNVEKQVHKKKKKSKKSTKKSSKKTSTSATTTQMSPVTSPVYSMHLLFKKWHYQCCHYHCCVLDDTVNVSSLPPLPPAITSTPQCNNVIL